MRAGDMLRAAGALLILLLAAGAATLGRAPYWLPLVYLVPGSVSFIGYGLDKRAARRGDRRIAERTLHVIDLFGGIAGGLLGQFAWRHKTSKQSFAVVTVLIALLHIGALALPLAGFWNLPWPSGRTQHAAASM